MMHKRCRHQEALWSPKRLVRVVSKSGNGYRLYLDVEAVGSAPYVALSHCWGTSQNFQAVRANLDGLRAGIPWDILPQTFKDAIIVVDYLGFSLIWIDSLCIVQDEPADWQEQSAQMSNIYENATVTIAAASAAADVDGFLKPREHVGTMDLASRGPLRPDRMVHFERAYDHTLEEFRDSQRERDPLASRAWAFQERLLASRAIRFGIHGLSWECGSGSRCECGSESKEKQTNLLIQLQKVLSSSNSSKIYDFWRNFILERYTWGRLTKASDKLPALSGVASRVYSRTGDKYIAGLWLSDIIKGLLWYVPLSVSRTPVVPDSDRAPSFSWASIEGEISHVSFRTEFTPHVQISVASSLLLTRDPFGQVAGGTLTAHGQLLSAWIFFSPSLQAEDEKKRCRITVRESRPTIENQPDHLPFFDPDVALEVVRWPADAPEYVSGVKFPHKVVRRAKSQPSYTKSGWYNCWFLVVGSEAGGTQHGLLLAVSTHHLGAFERLGQLSIFVAYEKLRGHETREVVVV